MIPKRAEPPEASIDRELDKPFAEWDGRVIVAGVLALAQRISAEWSAYRVAGAPYGDNGQGCRKWLSGGGRGK